jgi:CheY-like chemotaxis protein
VWIERRGRRSPVGIRVLVIDGQADSRWERSLALMAEPSMQMIELVGPGPDAIRRVARHRPDLVLLDIGGASASGLELLRRLKAPSAAPRVFLVAEVASAGLRAAMLEAGADGVVTRRAFTLQLLELVDRYFPPACVGERFGVRKPRPSAPARTGERDPMGPRTVPYRRVPPGEKAVN